jgi:hypothetical protein
MNTPENDDIHKLLQLKKHEQPPPGYFDNFLAEFHRRQRAEMLQRSVWQLAWDRVQAFFETDRTGAFGYVAATATVLVLATITAVNIVSPGNFAPADRNTASVLHASADRHDSLALELRPSEAENLPNVFPAQPQTSYGALSPHYVIDARPASYELPLSF